MSQHTGDKSRHNRGRRKKIVRREKMRALRKTLGGAAAAPAQPKPGTATET
jgi:hypothetical protein